MADISIARIAGRGLRGLVDARGRDNRTQYWLFLLLVFGPLVTVQIILPMVITFASVDLTGASKAGANLDAMEHQFQAMAATAYVAVALYLIGALLLLAATARRLHDRDRAGWWALALPLTLFATGLGQARQIDDMAKRAPQVMAEMQKKAAPDFADAISFPAKMQASTSGPDWTAIVGGLILLLLVVELARAGTAGPNRFGPPPE